MSSKELLQEIDKLDISEKIMLVENIWDSIAKANSTLPMPEWHKKELDKRYYQFGQGASKLHDWKGVHEEIKNRTK